MVHTLRLDNYYPTPRKLMLGTNSSFGTESIKIERGAGWDGLNLTATWHIPGREEPLRVALLDGDAMDVPPEVTKEAKDGVLVLAGLASGVQRASCNVEYLILEQAGVYGGADAEPTPELAAQVLEAALQAKADAEAAKANADKAQADAEKAQQAAKNAAADAAKAGPYAEDALAAKEAAELARNEAIAAQQAAENAAAAAAASKSAADTLAAEAARAAQAAENSKAAANNAADLAGENATAAQQAAATATAAANDAGQSASDAAASKAAAETAAKSAQDAQAAADKARDEAKAAQKGAEAARDATAKSAAAAKTSEDAAAKSAEDADRDANRINESMMQIAANKEAIGQLKDGKISKFYSSSQGNTNLPDSDAGRLVDLKLYGKSEQKQYSGKNLLNATLKDVTNYGITVSAKGNGIYGVSGVSEAPVRFKVGTITVPPGSYRITGCPPGGTTTSYMIYADDATNGDNFIGDAGAGYTFKVSQSATINVWLWFGDKKTINGIDFKPMITTDTSATYDDFEPYVGGIPSPNPEYPQEIKSVINPVVTISDGKGKQQTATLPYTLNAIPVTSGGNVTIDGQQYVADYVDIEKGVLVRRVSRKVIRNAISYTLIGKNNLFTFAIDREEAFGNNGYCNRYIADGKLEDKHLRFDRTRIYIKDDSITSLSEFNSKYENGLEVAYILGTYTETDLTPEEVQAFKALASYYPATNVSTTSDQLDGYTVFNYPISLANGWNYVKQQIGDTRDYLYDIDLVTAEAYVNSAYATAIAEMGV